MYEINLPDHLIIPSTISILILILIFYRRKQLFKKGKRKWFWISLTVFFIVYFLIVGGAAYSDISFKLTLRKFDLNGDGIFNGDEITTEQRKAMRNVISDTGRNFSVITGFIFSGIIAFFVFIIGKIMEFIKK